MLENGEADWLIAMTGADGTTLKVYDASVVGDLTGFPMTTGTWYFVGVSLDAGAGIFTFRAADSATWSTHTWTGGQSSHNAFIFRLGTSTGTQEWLNGCVAAVKGWIGTALTEAQLQNESWSYAPKELTNFTFWYPFLTPETTDYSGNAYTLSGGSGTTSEAGPPVGWRQMRVSPPLKDTIELVVDQATTIETAQPVQVLHEVGQAVATEVARATGTVYTVEVNTVTESDIPIEILDPIAIGVTPLTASAAAASAQSWSTASVTPTSQRLVLLCVSWAASTAAVANPIASVTGCGLTWVLVFGQTYGAATGTSNARHRMEVWRALGTAPTAGAITVTHATSQPGIGRCWSVFELFSTDLSGTNGSGAIRQTASNRATAGTTLTATLGAFGSASNATVGFGGGGNVMSVGTGFTAITAQRSTSTPDVSLITEWFLGIDTTVNCTQASDQMGVIGIEIKRRIVEPLLPGPVTEVDTAQAVTRLKGKIVAQASSSHTAQAVTPRRIKVFAIATSSETAQTIVRPILTGAVGQTALTNTAQPISARKTVLVGQATSSQAAQAVTGVRRYVVAQATGTELARPFTALKVKAVAQATGTSTAQPIATRKVLVIGQASSTNLAQAATRLKALAIGQAAGTDLALALSTVKVLAVGRASATEAAQAFTALRVRVVAQAAETGTALALSALKGLALGQATSSQAALALTAVKQVVLGQATSAELARALGPLRVLLQVVEPNHARDVVSLPALTAPVGQTAGTDAARPVGFAFMKVVTVDQATITNTAQGIAPLRLIPMTRVAESNVAQTISRLLVAQATETSTALMVTFSRPGTVMLSVAATGSATLGVDQASVVLSSASTGTVVLLSEQGGATLSVERAGAAELAEGT